MNKGVHDERNIGSSDPMMKISKAAELRVSPQFQWKDYNANWVQKSCNDSKYSRNVVGRTWIFSNFVPGPINILKIHDHYNLKDISTTTQPFGGGRNRLLEAGIATGSIQRPPLISINRGGSFAHLRKSNRRNKKKKRKNP